MPKTLNEVYTDSEYWNHYWKEEKRSDIAFYFDDILDGNIDWSKVDTYMEIGGAPGSVMAYLYHKYGIDVSTVDFTENEITDSFLKEHAVENYEIINADFLALDVSTLKKYDLVASWGFVEHFSKDICNEIIEKQKEMVSDDGYLVVEIPNIRKIFWLIYFFFNRDLIRIHNLEIMDLHYLKSRVLEGDEFKILYAGYQMTMNENNEYFVAHTNQKELCKNIVRRLKKMNLSDSLKRWFFPYIIIIAKRK